MCDVCFVFICTLIESSLFCIVNVVVFVVFRLNTIRSNRVNEGVFGAQPITPETNVLSSLRAVIHNTPELPNMLICRSAPPYEVE